MYYRIVIENSVGCGWIERAPDVPFHPFRLLRGRRLGDDEVPVPCRFSVQPDTEVQLVLDDFYPHVHLMSERMVSALQAAGVDNLQLWPAALEIPGRPDNFDYRVVNVVGIVQCADPTHSESMPVANSQYFLKLVIDPAKAGHLRLFRVAESKLDIVVNDAVAQALQFAGLRHVQLEPVQ